MFGEWTIAYDLELMDADCIGLTRDGILFVSLLYILHGQWNCLLVRLFCRRV